MAILYLNGQFVDRAEAGIDPLDAGFLLGDGLFETVRCEYGQLLFFEQHVERMKKGAGYLDIPFYRSAQELREIGEQVVDANGLDLARLRMTLSRGETTRLPGTTLEAAPTLLIHAEPYKDAPADSARRTGWRGQIAAFPVNHRSPLVRVKGISYCERLMARREANQSGFEEAILLNTEGNLAEGAMSNLFLFKEGVLHTPPVGDGALPGVMRGRVFELSRELGLALVEKSLTADDLFTADEAFMTNVLIQIVPLTRVDEMEIGGGNPGSATLALYHEHRRKVEEFLRILRRG